MLQGGAILLVVLASRYGGAETRVIQMAAALHGRRPYAVAVLAGTPIHERLRQRGLNVLPLPYSRRDPRHLWALYRAIRRHGFTVVDACNPQSQLWGLGAARLAGVPMRVWTVQNDYRDYLSVPKARWRTRVMERMADLGRLWGCEFIAVSKAIQEHLLSVGVPQDRIHLSYNAIDRTIIQPQADGNGRLRQTLGWGADTFVVNVTARLVPIKGHTYLLQALQTLRGERPQLRCLIVGDGAARASLQREAEARGLSEIVHFTGFQNDVASLLDESDLFCLPSLGEGLPLVMLEAALRRRPQIATAVGGVPETFVHGETARIVAPGDPEALANELRWVLHHRSEAENMARAAYEMVLTRFDPARMVEETLAVYDRA